MEVMMWKEKPPSLKIMTSQYINKSWISMFIFRPVWSYIISHWIFITTVWVNRMIFMNIWRAYVLLYVLPFQIIHSLQLNKLGNLWKDGGISTVKLCGVTSIKMHLCTLSTEDTAGCDGNSGGNVRSFSFEDYKVTVLMLQFYVFCQWESPY